MELQIQDLMAAADPGEKGSDSISVLASPPSGRLQWELRVMQAARLSEDDCQSHDLLDFSTMANASTVDRLELRLRPMAS